MTIPSPKSCLRDILLPNPQLVVPRSQVNLGEKTGPSKLVKQVINAGKWILILYRHLIQFSVIYTKSKGSVSFLGK